MMIPKLNCIFIHPIINNNKPGLVPLKQLNEVTSFPLWVGISRCPAVVQMEKGVGWKNIFARYMRSIRFKYQVGIQERWRRRPDQVVTGHLCVEKSPPNYRIVETRPAR